MIVSPFQEIPPALLSGELPAPHRPCLRPGMQRRGQMKTFQRELLEIPSKAASNFSKNTCLDFCLFQVGLLH